MELDSDLNLSEPFYDVNSAPPPNQGTIDRYIIQKNLLDNPTKCSYIYLCTDSFDHQDKILKFIKLYENEIERVKNEITTMRIVQHPNIIKMENYFRYGPYVCITLPYTPHRCLYWLLTQYYRNGLEEDIAISIMKQILSAVDYLHSNNIWHRDIKINNILLFDSIPNNTNDSENKNDQQNTDNASNTSSSTSTNSSNYSIIPKTFTNIPIAVLSDFGFAKIFSPGEKSTSYMGTLKYVAPEIINHIPYDNSADIWSLGICLFVMLTGCFPYSKDGFKQEISKGDLKCEPLTENKISDDAIDLFKRMCTFEPKKRITAKEALKHPWILSCTKTPEEIGVIDTIGLSGEFSSNFKI